jgi:hypothetical protein
LATLVLLATIVLPVRPLPAQVRGKLFPQPFLVEHHLVQTDTDGSVMVGEPVVDRYGGSWLVSERPDGSRLVIELAARTITEIDANAGTYSVITFDQLAELQRRLQRAELEQYGAVAEAGIDKARPQPRFAVTETSVGEKLATTTGAARRMLERDGVKRLQVRIEDPEAAKSTEALVVDVWVDPAVRLTPAAMEGFEAFDRALAATHKTDEVPFSSYVRAGREHAGGALPIRTRRPSSAVAARAGDASIIEDVVTRIEQLEELPVELVKVPDGFRRVPHLLEQLVAYAEEQAALFQQAEQ